MNKELPKLLSRLTALKANLPESSVSRKYADEFNSILSKLEEDSSEDLNDFKIPSSEIRPRQLSRTLFSSESYCDREFLLMKIDGVLGYFTLVLQPTQVKDQMGFKVEEND